MTDNYSIGDDVIVELPEGEHRGTVKQILCRYSFHEDTKYEVAGKDFITICTASTMRKNGRLF